MRPQWRSQWRTEQRCFQRCSHQLSDSQINTQALKTRTHQSSKQTKTSTATMNAAPMYAATMYAATPQTCQQRRCCSVDGAASMLTAGFNSPKQPSRFNSQTLPLSLPLPTTTPISTSSTIQQQLRKCATTLLPLHTSEGAFRQHNNNCANAPKPFSLSTYRREPFYDQALSPRFGGSISMTTNQPAH